MHETSDIEVNVVNPLTQVRLIVKNSKRKQHDYNYEFKLVGGNKT